MSKIIDVLGNVGKFAAIGTAAVGSFFAVAEGMDTAIGACEQGAKLAKYAISPDVYSAKTSRWGKTQHVNINPVTGNWKLDKSGKTPVNDKTMKLY